VIALAFQRQLCVTGSYTELAFIVLLFFHQSGHCEGGLFQNSGYIISQWSGSSWTL